MIEYVAAAILGLVTFWFWTKSRPRNFPPGPVALPVVNNLLSISMDEHLAERLEKLHSEYGAIFSLSIAGNQIWDVWVEKYDVIKELLNDSRFLDRKVFGFFQAFQLEKGIAFASGDEWRKRRRTLMQMFRHLGVGKKGFNVLIEDRFETFMENLSRQKHNHDRLDIKKLWQCAICNVVLQICFNEDLDYNDPEYRQMFYYIERTFELQNPSGVHWVLPFSIAKHLPISKELLKMRAEFEAKIMEWFNERQPKSRDEARTRVPECLSDCFWDQVLIEENPILPPESIIRIMIDLLLAGQETMSNSLSWFSLAMISYPDVQEKVFNELEKNFDLEQGLVVPFVMQDKCPYTTAVINECHRFFPVLYSTVDHTATEDIEDFHGYRIPKGTRVFANFASLFKDKTLWKYPDEFNPHNFLDEDGNFEKAPHFIQFGIGPRACAGENIARIELFVAFASLMRRYRIESPDGKPPSLVPKVGFVGVATMPFEVKLIEREI